jgi:hypothetical protein
MIFFIEHFLQNTRISDLLVSKSARWTGIIVPQEWQGAEKQSQMVITSYNIYIILGTGCKS